MLDTGTASIIEAESDESANERKELLRRELIKYRDISASHCENMLDATVNIIKSHSGKSFFAYDASLVRDGVFYAGYMLAKANDREEDMESCLKALGEMRWAFCKRATRIQTVRGVYAGVRQAKEVRARKEEEERRRQNARRATIPSHQPPLQSYNTGSGFSPQQAYALNQAQSQTSGQVNIHRYLMSSTESYPQLAAPIQADSVLPVNVDLQDTSPRSQPLSPSKDDSINGTRMTLPATHSPSSASDHSEPAELPPQSYYGTLAPFTGAQHGLQKSQPIPYSLPQPTPHQQRSASAQSSMHSEALYPTQQPIKHLPRYPQQQPYPLQQQIFPAGVAPGSMFPSSIGTSRAPASAQRVDTQAAFAAPLSAHSAIQPSPGSGAHADAYGGLPDPASATRAQTKFDMDVAEWMTAHPLQPPYAPYQTQLPLQAQYPPALHAPAQRAHAVYAPNPHQNAQPHGAQMHPHYPHAQKEYFYSGQ